MKKQEQASIQKKKECSYKKKPQTPKAPNLHTCVPMAIVITEGKGQMIATDFLGPLPKATRRLKHIVVCVDVFTKKVSLYAIPRPTTKSVLNIILNRYIPEHGEIKSVLSDQGKQFQNKHWAATLERHGIKAILTSIRRPQGNLAERVNREIGKSSEFIVIKIRASGPNSCHSPQNVISFFS